MENDGHCYQGKNELKFFEVATRPFRSCSWGVLMNGRHFALQISNGRFRAVKQKTDLFQHAPQSVSADHILIRVASSKSTSSKYNSVYVYKSEEEENQRASCSMTVLFQRSLFVVYHKGLQMPTHNEKPYFYPTHAYVFTTRSKASVLLRTEYDGTMS
ncbi:hypothetical protein M0802_006333 [Mischocyttarus mexicanus]|nr:hypothetical protein M0802_006333 [Mischocyttarus mexicanus]